MDINNNTQVSSININPVSKINLNSANKAFKASMDSKDNNVEDFKKDDIALLEEQNIQKTMEKQGKMFDLAKGSIELSSIIGSVVGLTILAPEISHLILHPIMNTLDFKEEETNQTSSNGSENGVNGPKILDKKA